MIKFVRLLSFACLATSSAAIAQVAPPKFNQPVAIAPVGPVIVTPVAVTPTSAVLRAGTQVALKMAEGLMTRARTCASGSAFNSRSPSPSLSTVKS